MLYCTHQIRTKAAGDTDTDYTDILLDTPWVGFNMVPGQTWAEIKDMMNTTVLPDGTKVGMRKKKRPPIQEHTPSPHP